MRNEEIQLGVTRQRLLDAAGEVFAEQGFRAATVRAICRHAEANVAAVNYHFGDKEKLYAAVLEYAHRCAMQNVPSTPLIDATPEQRLRGFVHAMIRGFLGEGRPAWHAKLMTREMAEPTGMLEMIVESNVRPRFMLVKSIVQDLLGGRGTNDELRRCAWSIVGQCFFYRFGYPVLKKLHPPLKYDDAEIAAIAEHIATFSLGAIKQLAAMKKPEQGGALVNFIAIKMLIGDRAKYLGIIMGLTFASLLITQQLGIFLGLMTRTYTPITDLALPDVWVMDPKVQFIDDIKPLQDTMLYRVRGVEGVEWAVPLYKGLLKARLENGSFQTCNVFGLDDATLIGGPPEMVIGQLSDLRRAEAVIVDEVGAKGKLARVPSDARGNPIPGAQPVPLMVGDTLELNDHRATVVGICRNNRVFQSQPIIYTTYSRATTFAPRERKLLSFVLVKAKPAVDHAQLCQRIEEATGLGAETRDAFKAKTFRYFMENTGIPINFGIAVVLGFLVGTAIAGQTFYNFTLENLRHFGALKAMGAGNWMLLRMILLQALLVGTIGYGLGVGLASIFGKATSGSELAFYLPWQLLIFTAAAVMLICVFSALLSIRKVITLEPAIVFKG